MVLSEWKIGENFRGYAAKMDEEGRLKSLATSVVSFVEPNFGTEIHQCDVSQAGATWGLVRTTVRDWASPNPTEYNYTSTAGTGVDIYVLDSGIEVTVGYFEGRATGGADFIENPPNPGDPNGHGTHIAGTIMAQSYGLARNATAISVCIVGASGAGSVQNMIDGINWVAQQASLSGKKSVMNLAVGGSQSDIVDSAVNACVEAGVHMVVVAGGSNSPACTTSPANAEKAITVAASDSSDGFALFSNYGKCVDIVAPGVNILSFTPDGNQVTFSGTSMAAAHVSGVVTKILSTTDHYDKPEEMKWYTKETATNDKLTGIQIHPTNSFLIIASACTLSLS